MKRIIGGFCAVLLAAGGYAWVAGPEVRAAAVLPYKDPAAVAAGRQVYLDYCASCHGADLAGEANWQQRDGAGYLPAPPHDEHGHTWHHPDEQLLAITRHGVAHFAGGSYRSRMGGYDGVLSTEEMLAVLAYIKSRWPAEIIARHNQINAQAGG